MKGTALFRKHGLGFVPVSTEARALFAEVPDNATAFLEVWTPRNIAQHKKFFAILNRVVEATGRWVSAEHLRRDILFALHRYDEHVNKLTGEVTKIPHSMSFASMPRAEFEALYDDTIKLLTEALGADPELLLEEAA